MAYQATRPQAVPLGPRDYRHRLRRLGPFAALVAPVGAVIMAAAVWRLWPSPSGHQSLAAAVIGWGFGALALPTALLVGLPFYGGPIRVGLVVLTSVVVWLVLGRVAERRATRIPVADWRDWCREYLWLAVPLWMGVVVGLAGFAFLVTRT